ncbi:asparagine synthase (glutamine-hydrolyzing) [Motiliproteus coralliicola]|uniref:asparagine synthase (glutamine-hydrolyzing) n=1 Tax=Motiliproteus coralliicola TaxID=2283196 RepID=A0A369WPJ6_9GAMM|nr:asparagine synthase (glutamine-hydrolyzing) [Motiliproteus coralliicola]RDE22989.1 asparagine synthase (glutamine-hydrolyzing) [Motiliproteus coralliicola]
MCGIAGVVVSGESGFRVSEALIVSMRDSMMHRGPDGGGTWLSDDLRVGLGHRRLSVIDLSNAAAQPMSSANQEVVVSFNGEIYNHADLRDQLKAEGVDDWRTDHSDTEVLLNAYLAWGIDCIHRFRGMFAIAIWDARSRRLYLVRDRFGVKPLYFSQHNGRLAFASEIKALLQDPEQPRKVNEDALFHYLSFLTTPAPMTLFQGISKLEAGCYLEVDVEAGRLNNHRYYELLDNVPEAEEVDDQRLAERVLQKLRQAVNIRKVSDVPMGVFLSGGIDSSSNAALFSEGSDIPIKTFSIGYEGKYRSYTNELVYAKQAADSVGAQYHERLLNQQDLLDFLDTMVHLQDEPIADPVCFPVYFVSQLARQNGVTVCHVGEGADELYWGYRSWKVKLALQKWADVPGTRWLQRGVMKCLEWLGADRHLAYEALRRSVSGQPVFWGGAEAFTAKEKQQLLSPRLRNKFQRRTSWEVIEPIRQRFERHARVRSDLNWMTYLDLNLRLPELLLMRVDKMSMGVSLEARVPFLDHEFVEFAMSIPEEVKTEGGQLKRVLKLAVAGLIPDNLIHRKKQGFAVPVYEWLFDRLGEQIKDDVRVFCQKTDYFDFQFFEELLEQRPGPQVWYLYNFVLWWNAFIAPGGSSEDSTDVA